MKNKILIVFILSVILIGFTTSCFARFDFTYDGVSYSFADIPDDGNNYFLLTGSYLFTSSVPITYLDSTTYSGYGEVFGKDANLYLNLGGSNPEWFLQGNYGSEMWRSNSNNSSMFIYSNHNILNKNSGKVVFQKAPVGQVEPMEIQQLEEIPQMVTKVVTIILPMILVITGVLLVIYLIRYKIFSQIC